MTMNWKRNSKKYIAGILTIALAVGASQSYGSMEVSAQERTLPGIEKLVQDLLMVLSIFWRSFRRRKMPRSAIWQAARSRYLRAESFPRCRQPQSVRQLWTVWRLQSFRRQVRLLFLPTAQAPELPEPRT